jgi:hypothetical protein
MDEGNAIILIDTPACDQNEVPDEAGDTLHIASPTASLHTSRSPSRSTSRYLEECGDKDVVCYGSVRVLLDLNNLDPNADADSFLT